MQAGGDVGFFGGVYSPNPYTHPGMDPAAGEGLCLLSIAECLSALFVPSVRDGVYFWGKSASAAAKLSGCYCDGVVLDIIAPPKPTVSGFQHRNLPSGPHAFIPTGPCPLRSAPALVRGGAGSSAAAIGPGVTRHPSGEDDGV